MQIKREAGGMRHGVHDGRQSCEACEEFVGGFIVYEEETFHKGLPMAKTATFQSLSRQRTRAQNVEKVGDEGGGGELGRKHPRRIRAKEHTCGGVCLLLRQFPTCSLLLDLPFYLQGHCSSLGCDSK